MRNLGKGIKCSIDGEKDLKMQIVFKKPIEEKKEKLYEKDRPRYEEQSEEEYLRHCERFFKGWEDEDKV
jgi:hypothetical protein